MIQTKAIEEAVEKLLAVYIPSEDEANAFPHIGESTETIIGYWKQLRKELKVLKGTIGSESIPIEVGRIEDMSTRGRMKLFREDDGDIIVSVSSERDGLVQPSESVQYCTPGMGGGRSPRTFNALINLAIAMDEDNKAIPRGDPSKLER